MTKVFTAVFAKHIVTDGCSGMQADYVPLSTKTPFVKGLTEYLSRRATGVG